MQPVDYTTLTAACCELRAHWLPARFEQVCQSDRYTLSLGLRTLDQRGWLTVSWHPQAARLGIGDPPPRTADTFTFSQQIRNQLNGLALVAIVATFWERVVDLQFAARPGEVPRWHLYVEVMGKYSNVILVNQDNLVVTAAHQVTVQQSSVRPVQTGQPYEAPPRLTDPVPILSEPQEDWQARICQVPGPLRQRLLKTYRGLSSALVLSMVQAAGVDLEQSTDTLDDSDWQSLFHYWRLWLQALGHEQFSPAWLTHGYTVLGWNRVESAPDVQTLLNCYYTGQLNREKFSQLRHRLAQKLRSTLDKLRVKAGIFKDRLGQSEQADHYRHQADLLMAHLQDWRPGIQAIALPSFETGDLTTIQLDPDKNAVQNAQILYKRHQKLRRARTATEPLLAEVNQEIRYLEQVEAAIDQLEFYQGPEDLLALEEIYDELIQQRYLVEPGYRAQAKPRTQFHRYRTPGGFELLIGRNNHQNDYLTFRLAGPYDLWFHTQEIPGSHVLLRLTPGAIADTAEVQFAANFAAYHSRSRRSKRVPVVYTQPKYVYKPKGAKPGMAIYTHEQVVWGQPEGAQVFLTQPEAAS